MEEKDDDFFDRVKVEQRCDAIPDYRRKVKFLKKVVIVVENDPAAHVPDDFFANQYSVGSVSLRLGEQPRPQSFGPTLSAKQSAALAVLHYARLSIKKYEQLLELEDGDQTGGEPKDAAQPSDPGKRQGEGAEKEAWPGAGFYIDFNNIQESDFLTVETQLSKRASIQGQIDFLANAIVWVDVDGKRPSYERARDKGPNHPYARAKRFAEKCQSLKDKLERTLAIELSRNQAAPVERAQLGVAATRQVDFAALIEGIKSGKVSFPELFSNLKEAKYRFNDAGVEQLVRSLKTVEESMSTSKEKAIFWGEASVEYQSLFGNLATGIHIAGDFYDKARNLAATWEKRSQIEKEKAETSAVSTTASPEIDEAGPAAPIKGLKTQDATFVLCYLLEAAGLDFEHGDQTKAARLIAGLRNEQAANQRRIGDFISAFRKGAEDHRRSLAKALAITEDLLPGVAKNTHFNPNRKAEP